MPPRSKPIKLQRWIDLLAALLRRSYPVPFDQLIPDVPGYQGINESSAKEVASRRRMFERDKDELRAFGVPIQTTDLGDGELGYKLPRADFYIPYLSVLRDGQKSTPRKVDKHGYRSLQHLAFEPDELALVAAAARAVLALGASPLASNARAAIHKLGHDLPVDALEEGAEGTTALRRGPAVEGELFETLSDAVARRKVASITYHSMGSDAKGVRTVHPYGLFFLGHWYLAAAAPAEPVVKNFRLSRISEAVVAEGSPKTPDFELPREFDLRTHARSREAWELGNSETTEVTVEVVRQTGSVKAALARATAVPRHPTQKRFAVRRVDPFARWLLSFAGDLIPVAPPEFVERYRTVVKETLALYSKPGRATRSAPRPPAPPIEAPATPNTQHTPSPDAAAQLRRILQLIPQCADDQPHRLAEVAAIAGADEKTLRRDLLALAERFDVPGGFVEGLEVYLQGEEFSVRSDHFLRPMRLTLPELASLELGLALLRAERAPDEHRSIEGARERLRKAMAAIPPDTAEQMIVHAERAGPAELALLARAREGLKKKRKLKLTYRKGDETKSSERTVSPLGVVHSSGQWYLVAHNAGVESVRVFRFDRIEGVTVTDQKSEPLPGYSAEAVFEQGRAFTGAPTERLVVRYGPRIARWIAEREGAKPAKDGSVTIEHPLGDEAWAVSHVLQYGPDAEVVGPAGVREKVNEKLKGL